MIVDNQSIKLELVNISDVHFDGKPSNLMTINFSYYMIIPAWWALIKTLICFYIHNCFTGLVWANTASHLITQAWYRLKVITMTKGKGIT